MTHINANTTMTSYKTNVSCETGFSHVHSAPRGARTLRRSSALPSTHGSCLSTRPSSLGPELDPRLNTRGEDTGRNHRSTSGQAKEIRRAVINHEPTRRVHKLFRHNSLHRSCFMSCCYDDEFCDRLLQAVTYTFTLACESTLHRCQYKMIMMMMIAPLDTHESSRAQDHQATKSTSNHDNT